MLKEFGHSLRMLLVMTVALGLIYPIAMTGFAQVVFSEQANGSLVYQDGAAVGSKWIGQTFTSERYFQSRPSNAGDGYDATSSSGSNLGPTSAKLMKTIEERAQATRAQNGLAADAKVPSDLVTASGSGLDPHISPEAAAIQVERIAVVRGIGADQVRKAVEENTENPQAGFMGDKRVNVLQLNLALDQISK